MSRLRYEGEDVDDAADRLYAEDVQREMDDKREAEQKRMASGASPEILSLQEAFLEGQRAGQMSLGASLNPNQYSTPEYDEWERGRSGVIGARLNSQRRVA